MIKETTPLYRRPSQRRQPADRQDLHLFNEGTHYRIYNKLGAHLTTVGGQAGTYFAVWAPNAQRSFGGRQLQWLGPKVAPAPGTRQVPGFGKDLSPGSARALCTSTTLFPTTRARRGESRSVRHLSREAAANSIGGLGPGIPVGRSSSGWRRAPNEIRCRRRFRFTKFTSVPGCEFRRRTTGR